MAVRADDLLRAESAHFVQAVLIPSDFVVIKGHRDRIVIPVSVKISGDDGASGIRLRRNDSLQTESTEEASFRRFSYQPMLSS